MWSIIGHEAVVEGLARGLRSGHLAHAYLFVGPSQVGKRTLALELAKALNCDGAGEGSDATARGLIHQASADGPCGRCRSCRRISDGKHSDILVVQVPAGADLNRKAIGIDQIREVGRFVSLEPFEGRVRVVIVDGVESMTTEAANAFLKTLEEPPAAVVLILLAEQEEWLPETIRSRCRRFTLTPLPRDVVATALREHWGAVPEQANFLAGLARGRLGWAVTALQDAGVLAERTATLAVIHRLCGAVNQSTASRSDRFDYARDLATRFGQDRSAVARTLELWREWWRDVLLVGTGVSEAVVNSDDLAAIKEAAMQYNMSAVIAFLEAIKRTIDYLQSNVNARLALEVLMLSFPAPTHKRGGRVASPS